MLVLWGLEVLANVSLAGKQHQKVIWEELFPLGFLSLAKLGTKEVSHVVGEGSRKIKRGFEKKLGFFIL
jgi:hypothetical protein